MDSRTQICALIGSPIGHSLSPAMHNAGFRAENLNFVYLSFETTEAKAAIDAMRALGVRGYNVTMPLKQLAFGLVDELDPLAGKCGAINTIVNADGKLKGYNTDVLGAIGCLEKRTALSGKKVLLVGCGGAGSAIAAGLSEKKAGVFVVDRDAKKAEALAKKAGAKSVSPETIGGLQLDMFDILVNASPAGMHPNEKELPLPEGVLEKLLNNKKLIVFDIVYNPVETRLLKMAKIKGIETIGGTEMLLGQAIAAFELFTEKKAPAGEMEKALLSALGH
ncbi:MAG: shikimate dehydrogenase [Candidatus Diapherotrites archaeon]|nr:shikimate dehydrogenase [Candidatus Diapherotrites archaeon]